MPNWDWDWYMPGHNIEQIAVAPRPDCCGRTSPRFGLSGMVQGHTGGPCTRKATYTNGRDGFWCTQHAKEPPTVMRKATGRIRSGLVRLDA